jgi:hypothetical protein
MHGARAVLPHLAQRDTPLGRWVQGLLARAHKNIVVVALAMNASSAGSAAFQVPRHPDVLQCALGLCLQAPRKRRRLRSARREENSAKDQRILTLEERLMQSPLIALGLAPFSREVWTSFTTRNSTIGWTHPWMGGIYFARR